LVLAVPLWAGYGFTKVVNAVFLYGIFYYTEEASPTANQGENVMSDSTAVDVVRSAVMALNDGDIDGYLRRFDPSCPRWVSGFAQPLTLSEIGGNFRQLRDAFEGLYLGEDLLFGDDQFACARWRLRGIHVKDYMGYPPSGQAIDAETCEIYQVSGGVVVTSWVYGDLGQLFRQIAGGQEGAV
jgi:predicted ester cyclase